MTFGQCTKLTNYDEIPEHWGGGGSDNYVPSACCFELLILENDFIFTLPIHQTYKDMKGDEQNANYNFTINWGDNSFDTVTCNGTETDKWNTDERSVYYQYPADFPTENNPMAKPAIPGIQHRYRLPGIYLVTISKNSNDDNIIDALYVHSEDKYTWRQLTYLYTLGKLHWKSFSHAFCNAQNLISLPNQKLLHTNATYNTNTGVISNGSLVFDWSYMFYNCSSLIFMPEKMTIHHNCNNLSYMFTNAFQNPTNYLSDTYNPDFFPSSNFYSPAIDISYCFYNCSGLITESDTRKSKPEKIFGFLKKNIHILMHFMVQRLTT